MEIQFSAVKKLENNSVESDKMVKIFEVGQ